MKHQSTFDMLMSKYQREKDDSISWLLEKVSVRLQSKRSHLTDFGVPSTSSNAATSYSTCISLGFSGSTTDASNVWALEQD